MAEPIGHGVPRSLCFPRVGITDTYYQTWICTYVLGIRTHVLTLVQQASYPLNHSSTQYPVWPSEVESYVLSRLTLKHAAKDDLKVLVLLPSLPGCYDYGCTSPHRVSMMPGSQPRAPHTPGWQSINSTTSPAQSFYEREESTTNLQALPRRAFSTSLGMGLSWRSEKLFSPLVYFLKPEAFS